MTDKNYLLLRKSEKLRVGSTINMIDPSLLQNTFTGGVVKDSFWQHVYNKGSQSPTPTDVYEHEFFHKAVYAEFIPAQPAYFFRGLCQALKCLYDNPALIEEVVSGNKYQLHLPFFYFMENGNHESRALFAVAHVLEERGKPKLRTLAYDDVSQVLDSAKQSHLVVMRKKVEL